jgi:hypothetical protein
MLFMVMHKTNAQMESENAKPDQTIIQEMGKLIGESIEKGMFVNGAGLKRSAERVRIKVEGGKTTVTQGPLTGDNELIAGFAQMRVKSMDEALHWAKRFADVIGDVEMDVGPVVERWDLGLMDKPQGAPLNVLSMHKADKASESDTKPTPELMAKMGALMGEAQKAGVLVGGEGLKSSKHGARLIAKGGKNSWVDGPFAESKELIAGFSIIKVDSLAEAKAWTERYAKILGDIEVDVREVSA